MTDIRRVYNVAETENDKITEKPFDGQAGADSPRLGV